MAFQWRRFQFFDKDSPSTDDNNNNNNNNKSSSNALIDFPHITASSSSPRHLCFANSRGLIRLVNRDFHFTEFRGYSGELSHLQLLQKSSFCVSVGEDDGQQVIIKIWALDRADFNNSESQIFPVRKIPCFSTKFPPAYVTSLAVTEDLTQCAIGLNNGQIILFDGLMKDKAPKQSYIIKEIGAPITAIYFKEENNSGENSSTPSAASSTILFIVTGDNLSTCQTKSSGSKNFSVSVLDSESGGDVGLTFYVHSLNLLIVGRRDGVHFYDSEEKNICFAFEGNKKYLSWHRNYLILISEAKDQQSATNNSTLIKDQITIYDLKNKFIAYQGKSDPVQSMLPAFNSLFALNVLSNPSESSTHSLLALNEKDLSAKLEILFKKNLYQIALGLAESHSNEGNDSELLFEIYAMYGDHCLAQGDYDSAINQYIETIGHTEPSYVIRQFLDAQRIHQLTKYLQALHERNRANSDHTTLLLNCYTKLKDLAKLEEFVKSDTWKFDVTVAIAVCRQAGYESHALYLANKFHKHRDFINITLEKPGRSHEAINYIKQLKWKDAENLMREFGKKLLTESPELTTEIIIKLSTGWSDDSLPSDRSNPDHYIHFFVDHSEQLQNYLEAMQADSQASHLVYNTLIELYLRQDSESHSDNHSARVMSILKSYSGKYDLDHALVLCKFYNYEKGLLFLYAKLNFYTEILQYHIDQKQFNKILPVCKKFGQHQKELWVQALNFFAQNDENNQNQGGENDFQEEITQCLEFIERENILTPVAVIKILSGPSDGDEENISNNFSSPQPFKAAKPFSVVKDYLLKFLRLECHQLKVDRDDILAYESDTKTLKADYERLTSGKIIFQQSKCSQCNLPLTLPAAHYLCNHSYHSKCVAEDVSGALIECPKCSAEFSKVRSIRSSMHSSAQQHDRFFKQIEDAQDGFQTVAEYFGRGIFNSNQEQEE